MLVASNCYLVFERQVSSYTASTSCVRGSRMHPCWGAVIPVNAVLARKELVRNVLPCKLAQVDPRCPLWMPRCRRLRRGTVSAQAALVPKSAGLPWSSNWPLQTIQSSHPLISTAVVPEVLLCQKQDCRDICPSSHLLLRLFPSFGLEILQYNFDGICYIHKRPFSSNDLLSAVRHMSFVQES